LVACLAALAFVLSFSSLRDLAASAGVAPHLTWLWPLVVDGNIVINTVAGMALRPRGRTVTWYPWTALIIFAAISVTGNALHAGAATGSAELAIGVAAAVSAVPAVALLQSTHLFVVMLSPAPQRGSAPTTLWAELGPDRAPINPAPGWAPVRDLAPVARGTDGQTVHDLDRPGADNVPETDHLARLVRAALVEGRRVTGSDVARWLGTSERTGRRRLLELAARDNELAAALRTRSPVHVSAAAE